MANWYEKLSQYFPIEEMKSRQHMEVLLRERGDLYHKDESPLHVLMYVELEHFVFVDYLLVTREARGQGLGNKLIDKLKAKGKPILLEVEPVDYADSDTVKRQRFYQRQDFRNADAITYRRRSLATREVVELEILYWTPDASITEADIFDHMWATYEKVHTYRDEELYGESYQAPEEVLFYQTPAQTSRRLAPA